MIARSPVAVPGLLLCMLAGPAFAAPPVVPTLAADQLRPGQHAVVRTVFVGTRIDSFDAEIVGVLNGGRAEGDMILARATTERVVRSGVAQGMSGSPVYVDGRLIGALSSGWSFSREPVFGITPISEMLSVLDRPATESGDGTAGPGGVDAPGGIRDVAFGPLRWSGADDELASTAPVGPRQGLLPLALPLCGTINPAAVSLLAPWFGESGFRLAPGGRAQTGAAPVSLEPGSAVAVDLLRGDLQLAAIGTVTYRDGDRVLLFGHPFFQAGDVRLPISTATITTIIASDQSSFKLGQRGLEVGLATQDRRAAVAGRLGARGVMMPFSLDVLRSGEPPQRFRFESITDKQIAPILIATATLNGLLESGGGSGAQTLRWSAELYRRGAPTLRLEDMVAGETPLQELAAAIVTPVRFLLNNPFERCQLDSVRLRVEVVPHRTQWTLRGARLLDQTAAPGARVRVRCEMESWRGDRRSLDLTLRVPEEAGDGSYVIYAGGGGELNRYEAQRLPGRYRATSLDDGWRRLGDQRPGASLRVAMFAVAPEITRRGSDYPELPLSALALLSGNTAGGEETRPGTLARLDETTAALDGPVRGEILLALRVDRTVR